jgi:hypothetical protein
MMKLTRPQETLLLELAEPNQNVSGEWYFTHRAARSLRILERHGLAKGVDWSPYRIGFRITTEGREHVRTMMSVTRILPKSGRGGE